jgi:hypothetical protein
LIELFLFPEALQLPFGLHRFRGGRYFLNQIGLFQDRKIQQIAAKKDAAVVA